MTGDIIVLFVRRMMDVFGSTSNCVTAAGERSGFRRTISASDSVDLTCFASWRDADSMHGRLVGDVWCGLRAGPGWRSRPRHRSVCGWTVAKRGVWSARITAPAATLDNDLHLAEIIEELAVQKFVPEFRAGALAGAAFQPEPPALGLLGRHPQTFLPPDALDLATSTSQPASRSRTATRRYR